MPAIQPALLRQQAALLAEHYDDPAAFVRSLHHLFELYADRTHRSGQGTDPPPLIATYLIRPPVLRQIVAELADRVEADPATGLSLIQALWDQPYLEFRLLASSVLGQVPPASFGEMVMSQFLQMVKTRPEERILQGLLNNGLSRIRKEDPENLLQLIDTWLNSRDVFVQQVGLEVLLTLVKDPNYENIPVFFRLITPISDPIPSQLRSYVLDILDALAQRSPRETAYFLQRTLELSGSSDAAWLIRQCVRSFPDEIQVSLRAMVRNL